MVQNLENFFFKKCHETHQIDQRNVLNTKMYVGGGGGGQKSLLFSRVKSGENWPNSAGQQS